MSLYERSDAVLLLAVREAVKNYEAASASLIRERVESCLSTALAMCKEDRREMHELINKHR